MPGKPRRRYLAFEQLERKSAPSSLLLLLDPAEHSPTTHHANAVAEHGSLSRTSAEELLRFIVDHTGQQPVAALPSELPTVEACAVADDMLRLHDSELRSMVLLSLCGFHDE